jgi:hypothetical protein
MTTKRVHQRRRQEEAGPHGRADHRGRADHLPHPVGAGWGLIIPAASGSLRSGAAARSFLIEFANGDDVAIGLGEPLRRSVAGSSTGDPDINPEPQTGHVCENA